MEAYNYLQSPFYPFSLSIFASENAKELKVIIVNKTNLLNENPINYKTKSLSNKNKWFSLFLFGLISLILN